MFPTQRKVLLWKRAGLNDAITLRGNCYPNTLESPLRTEVFMDACSAIHQGKRSAITHEISAIWISTRTQGTNRCSSTLRSPSVRKETCPCDNTAAFSRREHIWISFRAQDDVFMQEHSCGLMPRAHWDLSSCARQLVHARTQLHSHTVSRLGCLSVRKATYSCDNTAAFSRREHTWILLPVQEDFIMREHSCVFTPRQQKETFHRKDGCVPTPQAHLDLSPCAKRHIPAKRRLCSHATSTLGSRSVRKETCSIGKTAAISRGTP